MLPRLTLAAASAATALAMLVTTGCFGGGASGPGMGGGAARTLVIYQRNTDGSAADPFPVDTSQLAPDALERQPNASEGRTMIAIKPGYPVRVIVVPVTQP